MRGWIAFAVPAFVLGTLVERAPNSAPNVGGEISSPAAVAGPIGPPVIINPPYSAETISTFDKVLSSGKHVHGEAHGKAFRDSQGGTCYEADAVGVSGMQPKAVLIFIIDPVERRDIELDSRTMIEHAYPWRVATARPTATGALRPGASAGAADPAAASPVAPAPADQAPADELADSGASKKTLPSEDLGTREMDGRSVSGTKLTLIANPPSGGDGQSRTWVRTRWEARQQQILVLTETDDTKSGHSSTKLVHIVRTEPDAALFQIRLATL